MAAIHYQFITSTREPVLAFTLFPVTSPSTMLLVLLVAVAVLVAFLVWSKRVASDSFFLGVLAGTGLVLSFDIVWVHWLFGLHHLTNTRMDLVLEPLLVVLGIAFLWFGIKRELSLRPAGRTQGEIDEPSYRARSGAGSFALHCRCQRCAEQSDWLDERPSRRRGRRRVQERGGPAA
jgi:hypothetical protein